MGKAYEKTKNIIKEELNDRKETRIKIEKMSDKELKHLAITKGQPYEDAWLKRQKNKKRLNDRLKNI